MNGRMVRGVISPWTWLYSSNLYSNNQGDLPRNFSDKNVQHTCIRVMGTQKYLKKSCYHRIECTTVTFLAVFMCRRPLNSAALSTTTHRKLEKMSDGTSTQVRAQMTNKYRIKIIHRELYNVRDLPWGRDQKNRERIL